MIDEEDAGAWLESQLAIDVPRNTVTVVQHSLMWQYLPDETKQRAEAAIAEAGERATRRRPLAHVSFEPAPDWHDGGGFLITVFALSQLGGDGGVLEGADRLFEQQRERFNSVGGPKSSVPFGTIFSGIFLLNLFYWTTNQQIIQRTFGASSLAEGQKGVLLTGALKLLGPLYLVVPGMIAFSMSSLSG